MNTTTPEREKLETELEKLKSTLSEFEEDPDARVAQRLSEISDGIANTTDRGVVGEGNLSVHGNLKKIKEGIERDPDAFVRRRVGTIEEQIEIIESELEEI